jgi:prolyl oligopeptidase
MRSAALLAISVGIGLGCGHATPTLPPDPVPDVTPAPATPDAAPAAAAGPPVARTVEVVEELFGAKLSDPYRWMEAGGDEFLAWARGQHAHTRAYLDGRAGRDKLVARLEELAGGTSALGPVKLAGGRMFFTRLAPGAQLPVLVVRDADGSERTLVDPAAMSTGGSARVALNEFRPSPDGSLLAYDLAPGGGEVSTIHVMDVATGKDLPDQIERVWGETTAAWLADGKRFLYSQVPEAGPGVDVLQNWRVKLHVLGAPVADDVVILEGGKGAYAIEAKELPITDAGGGWVIALAAGARSEARIAVAKESELDRTGAGKTPWRVVAEYADGITDAQVHGDRLYLITYKDASNRKIVSVPLKAPKLAKARVEIAEDPTASIEGMAVARDALYVRRMVGGRGNLLRRPWKGSAAAAAIALPVEAWTRQIAADPAADGAVVRLDQWTQPGAHYRYDVKRKAFVDTGLVEVSNADTSGVVAEEVSVTSSDGTTVPLSIIRRKDLALDGSHPTVVTGYGAYGFSLTAGFSPTRHAWNELGGITAVCHVRGGGENGRRWQVDGSRDKKMNGVHDLAACGEYLVAKGYTSNAKMFAQGTSAGGILVGRAITERPELFAAANIRVGMTNPVRLAAAENGANQFAEFGDPSTEDGFKSLYGMDPYHHVADGTRYPAVLFAVGLNDHRVAPWMGAKMAARLQVASTSGNPVLLRVEGDAGHGVGSTRDQLYGEAADYYAFFMAIAGDPDFAKAR